MLVEYAGKDPTEVPIYVSECRFLLRQSHTRPQRAYRMFLAGTDTAEIARRLRYREPTIIKWITTERCKRLGVKEPQWVKP